MIRRRQGFRLAAGLACLCVAASPALVAGIASAQDLSVTPPDAPVPDLSVEPAPVPGDVTVAPPAEPVPDLSVEPATGLQDAATIEEVQPVAPIEEVQPVAPIEEVQPVAPSTEIQDTVEGTEIQPAATPDASITEIATPTPESETDTPEVVVVEPEESGDLEVSEGPQGQGDLRVEPGSEHAQIAPVDDVAIQGSAIPVQGSVPTPPLQGIPIPIQEPEPPALHEVVAHQGWDAYLQGAGSAAAPGRLRVAGRRVMPLRRAWPEPPPPRHDLERYINRLRGFAVSRSSNDDFVRSTARELAGFNAGRSGFPGPGGPRRGNVPELIEGTSGWKPVLTDDNQPSVHVTGHMAMGYFHPRSARAALHFAERPEAGDGASQQDVESGLIAIELGEDLRRGRISVEQLIDELRLRLEDPTYDRGVPDQVESRTNGFSAFGNLLLDALTQEVE